MALIVFHAGMPKTGSTNIQEWLAEQSATLRERGVECVRITRHRDRNGVILAPVVAHGSAMSAFFASDIATRPSVVAQVCDALADAASRADVVVVSGESYEVLFNAFGRREALAPLDALAAAHPLRVAYYVRPQHSWLESAWLQWGFRHVAAPAEWIHKQRTRIDYLDTLHAVRDIAPNVAFEMRPFRKDLLHGHDVVRDFAHVFLGVDDEAAGLARDRRSNRSLPLEAALLLRGAPPGLFWSSIHDNKSFYPLKNLVLAWNLPETDRARRARAVLHRYAHATFETDNQKLIQELGWATDDFIPAPPADDGDGRGLAELDDLWHANASETERLVFYRALESVLAQSRGSASSPSHPAPEHALESRPSTRPLLKRARAIARRARDRVKVGSAATTPPTAARRAVRNDGDPRVVDVAADVGLDLTTRTFGAVVFDYDNDGWPDIFLGRHDAPALLFKNDRGHFRRVPSVVFPGRTDRHCAAAGDLTGDGRLDLFCVVGGDSGHGAKRIPNELWLQQPDGTFVNEGAQPGLADPYGRGREALLFDATGDGRLDILVGNVSPRSDGEPSPNRLFRNLGNGIFRPAPELGLDLEYSVGGAGAPGSRHGGGNWPMGRLAALDTDGNGWTDVLMCAKAPNDRFQCVHLFQNDHGRGFREISADVGLAGVPARDVAIADMDGDGQPDLVVVDGRGLSIYLNECGKFRLGYQRPIEHAFRVAVADADGDGRNDVYVMCTSGVPGPDIADLLLVRNGTSLDFTALPLPTVEGTVRDDAVYPIDYDQDGKFEFLVLHGHSLHAAPIQLISLQ